MRNVTKLLCVVLALVVAMSAASCSLSKQYAYKDDDVELPIGLYIFYLYEAYNNAQSYAQKDTAKYDAEKGTYDGSKSFLKMEITDDDGKTAVAEDWIKEKAAEYMNEAIAIAYEYKRLGCTIDEASLSSNAEVYKQYYWDGGYKDVFEGYGINYDSFILATLELQMMRNSVFLATYKDVTDEELKKFYEENYSAYRYFSVNLFTENTDENNSTTYDAIADAQVKAYTTAFEGYAAAINSGEATFDEQLALYQNAYDPEATPTDKQEKIDPETTDKLKKAVLEMKEGEAKAVTIKDETKNADVLYLIYKESAADTTETYFKGDVHDTVLSVMKEDDFKDLLKKVTESTDGMSSACSGYKPSMFENTK